MRINVRVRVRVCNATATTRECYGVHMDVLPYHLSAHAVTGIDKDVKKHSKLARNHFFLLYRAAETYLLPP